MSPPHRQLAASAWPDHTLIWIPTTAVSSRDFERQLPRISDAAQYREDWFTGEVYVHKLLKYTNYICIEIK